MKNRGLLCGLVCYMGAESIPSLITLLSCRMINDNQMKRLQRGAESVWEESSLIGLALTHT